MKTVKKGKEIERVEDQEAQKYIARGWNYCSKQEWKQTVRDKENKQSGK